MPSSLIQRSFAAGEIGPELYGRADQVKYQTGLAGCLGFIVMRSGGVTRRTGSGFIAEVKDSSSRTYFIKFVFNDDQTYVIEVGDSYFRFIRLGAQLIDGGVPYEVETPYVAADLSTLKFVQSGDVVTITHPNYETRELKRTGHVNWTLEVISFVPSLDPPGAPTVTAPGIGTTTWRYVVTSVKDETFEESIASAVGSDTGDAATIAAPHTLTWTPVAEAGEYNVYIEYPINTGTYCFIGIATEAAFTYQGGTPDAATTPPTLRNPLDGAGNYPSTVTYFQQRRVFANSYNAPEGVWTTRTGLPKNFTRSSPLQSDDAVTFFMTGRKVNAVRHMIELGGLLIFTSAGEWVVAGDADGVLKANQPPNLQQRSYNGSSDVMPAIVGNTIIYVQDRGNKLRDFQQDLNEGSKSKDLSIFSPHLFDGYIIERLDYAQVPHSIVWCVRSDGTLLGLTYLREHELWGWHRHETDGIYEEVCCVPEGDEDAVYVIVRREINGVTKRYIERFASLRFTDVSIDALYLDSFLTYDGRNETGTTLTLSSAGGWTHDDVITITASGAAFSAGDVGNAFVIRRVVDGDALTARVVVSGYTSGTVVTGIPDADVPVPMWNVPYTAWSRAVDQIGGLDHLEGKSVVVLADGNVLGSEFVVTGGLISLARAYEVVHVGLPFNSDFETLDLDVNGEQMRDRRKNITSVSLLVKDSRGGFIGSDFDHLLELKPEAVAAYNQPVGVVTGIVEMPISSTWNQGGRFVVRQSDPLPMTILSAIPCGNIGG